MRTLVAVALGVVLLCAALLVTAPATLLDARLGALSEGHLRLANATGTIWNGSGEVVLLPAGAREPLRWQLQAWPLLRGEIRGAIGSDPDAAPTGTVVYAKDHLELRGLNVALPVESIVPLITAARIALAGTLVLQLNHLVWQGNALEGQVALQWRNASVPGPRVDSRIALGEVRIDLGGSGAELAGPVRNSGGDVDIVGQLALSAAGAAKLDATLRPRDTDPTRAELVTAALSTLGLADGQGGYAVRWSGAWR
jgi:general secretion pathway protein N